MFVNPDFFFKVCVIFSSYKYAGTNKQKRQTTLMGVMESNTVHLGLIMSFKLVAQIQQVSSDWVAVHWSQLGQGTKDEIWNRSCHGRCCFCWVWVVCLIFFCALFLSLLFFLLAPLLVCWGWVKNGLCGAAGQQFNSWGGASQSVLWNLPLSEPSECVPVQLSCDRGA